jgi:hypothetical protein
MGIKHARHNVKRRINRRPTEVAKAEIMIMNQEERIQERRRKRMFFTALDFFIIFGFGLAIYSILNGEYFSTILFLIIGIFPLIYFLLRRVLRNNAKKKK